MTWWRLKIIKNRFTENALDIDCYLYDGTFLRKGTCKPNSKVLTCEFVGKEFPADCENPTNKFYYNLVNHLDNDYYETQIIVAVNSGSYIKYSIVLLLTLLVLWINY